MLPPEFVFMIVISDLSVFLEYSRFLVQTCSTSSPSGNLVDGLPLVVNTGEDRIGPALHR